jgi:hypothetical protein
MAYYWVLHVWLQLGEVWVYSTGYDIDPKVISPIARMHEPENREVAILIYKVIF